MNVQEYIQSGAIESYVLGLATPEERAEVERYRLQYPEVDAAIAVCESAIEANAFGNAVPVDNVIWNQVEDRLRNEGLWSGIVTAPSADTTDADKDLRSPAATAGKGNVIGDTSADGSDMQATMRDIPGNKDTVTRIRPRTWRNLAAAAAVLLLVSVGLNILLYYHYHRVRSDYASLVRENDLLLAGNRMRQDSIAQLYTQFRAVAAPGVQRIALKGVEGKEASFVTVYWNGASEEVWVYPNQLPPAPRGRQFQLWALVDGKPVDAGLLEDCNGFCRLKPVARADAFAITLEKEGGSAVPDLTQLYVIGKIAG